MHVVFQFPIVDFRLLLEEDGIRLVKPNWPTPDTNKKHFIRHFGKVKKRNFGGIADWSGEETFCNAHLSARYDNLHTLGFPFSNDQKAAIGNSYRRFYSNGNFMNKIELGFVDNSEKTLRNMGAGKELVSIISFLKHYANLPVAINGKKTKLFRAGTPLAENYCDASTFNSKIRKDLHNYVSDGEVCVLTIFSTTDGITLPTQAIKINEYTLNGETIKLYGYKLHHEGDYLKVWIIEIPHEERKLSAPLTSILRNLRINLMRIHAEKETIRILLNGIKAQKISFPEGSKKPALVDSYLKETAETLFSKKRYKLEQASMLDFALQSEDVASPGSFSSLEESIYYFNDKFTRKNVDKLLEGMTVDNRKTILFLCSSPTGKNPLNFGQEFKKIRNVLDASSDRGNYRLEIETGVIKGDLSGILNKYRPDYLHVSMHSSPADGLYFENDAGGVLPMSAAEFAQVLKTFNRKHKPVVVVLSACNSKSHAEAIKGYCNYTMGTKAVFPEAAGVVYAHRFYEILFNDNSTDIPYCHEAGILGIQQFNPAFDPVNEIPVHDIPVLFY